MSLSNDEQSVLSGSWDKTILDWDLNTAQVKRSFTGSGGQISAIEMRPISTLSIPATAAEPPPPPLIMTNGTFSALDAPRTSMSNGVKPESKPDGASAMSPSDSLFGGNEDHDSLFGDDDGTAADITFTNDDDDEFANALRQDLQQQPSIENDGDFTMDDTSFINSGVQLPSFDTNQSPAQPDVPLDENATNATSELTQFEKPVEAVEQSRPDEVATELTPESESTFLDAAIDGTIRIWDRRMPNPVARIIPPRAVPPWCMHACWSPDGNFIYAGRRNGTVDEYSVHRGFSQPRRSLRLPAGSGAVSAMRALPNGRHLVW